MFISKKNYDIHESNNKKFNRRTSLVHNISKYHTETKATVLWSCEIWKLKNRTFANTENQYKYIPPGFEQHNSVSCR